ncbi:MAG TPA: hypothetical protein DEH78_05345 [Solibacterales bacterium]|nr:hypothetical protein [Bryobacterales bacterium]
MKSVWSSLNRLWCQAIHPDPMWPVNGQYRCPQCLRVYQVPWEERREQRAFEPARKLKHAPVPVIVE